MGSLQKKRVTAKNGVTVKKTGGRNESKEPSLLTHCALVEGEKKG